jgi:hypothetical protein
MDNNIENHAGQDAPAHANSEHASPIASSPSPPVRARTRGATGPRTAAGKAISSRNAARFGFFSKNLFLANSAKREYSYLSGSCLPNGRRSGPQKYSILKYLLGALFSENFPHRQSLPLGKTRWSNLGCHKPRRGDYYFLPRLGEVEGPIRNRESASPRFCKNASEL